MGGLIAVILMIETLAFPGFAPDLDPNVQVGSGQAQFVDCDGFFPTARGFRRMPSLVNTYPQLTTRVSPADDGSCYGAYVARFLDGGRKLFAGTKTALYFGSGGVWTHYSTLEDFSTDSGDRWRFAMFGNDCIATNGSDSVQIITNVGSDFVALAGNPPSGKVVSTVNPGGSGAFVFMLNLFSIVPGNALTPTMWWCSGIGNDTSWTPDIATQSANGYLDDTPGEILGAKSLGRNLIVYKERAVYVFEYTGPPTIWATRVTSTEAGALSHEAVADLGDAHFVMGFDNFYLVDGSGAPQAVPCPLRRFLFEEDLNRNYQSASQLRYDRNHDVVFCHYPSVALTTNTTPQTCDKWVAWHRPTGKWTRGATDVQQVVYPELPGTIGLTYGDFGSLYPTWGSADDVAYDSYIFSGSTDIVQAVFQPEAGMYTINGTPESGGYLTLGDYGDGEHYIYVRRMRPKFSIYPETAGTNCQNTMRDNLGSTTTVTGSPTYMDQVQGWVNLRDNRRYHRFKYNFPAGDCEIAALDVDYVPAGVR